MQRRGFIVRLLGLFGLGWICRGVEAAPGPKEWRTYAMEYKRMSPEDREKLDLELLQIWREGAMCD